jgi:hypothetical protein
LPVLLSVVLVSVYSHYLVVTDKVTHGRKRKAETQQKQTKKPAQTAKPRAEGKTHRSCINWDGLKRICMTLVPALYVVDFISAVCFVKPASRVAVCWFQMTSLGEHDAFYNTPFLVWWALVAVVESIAHDAILKDPDNANYLDHSFSERYWTFLPIRCMIEPTIMTRFVWSCDGRPPVLLVHSCQVRTLFSEFLFNVARLVDLPVSSGGIGQIHEYFTEHSMSRGQLFTFSTSVCALVPSPRSYNYNLDST